MSEEVQYATVSWTMWDILSLTEDPDTGEPKISEEEAITFLENNSKHIQDRIVELGWEVIDTLMQMEGLL
jgi:hypothetical protein